MATAKKTTLGRMIKTLTVIIPSMFNIARYVKTLIEREAQLFVKNIVLMLILAVLSAILLAGAWFCLLAMLYLYLITKLTVMVTLSLLVLINILLLVITSLCLMRIKDKLFDFFSKYQHSDEQ